MRTMNITRIWNPLRVALKPSALALALGVGLGSTQAMTPRSFTGTAITENFDGLTATGTTVTLLTGWDAGHFSTNPQQGTTGGNGLTTVTDPLVVDNGNFGTGGAPILANFGTTGAPDRALGSFARTTPAGDQFLQVAITNDSGSPITAFELTYTGEEWRSSATPVQQLTVWYSATDATSGFVSMGSAFTFNSPNNSGSGAIDGNATGNRTVISGTYTPATPIAPGSTIYIRWYDINDSGIADDFLAIDDFSFGLPVPAANILTFGPGATITGTDIAWYVPNGTDPTSLAPTYTLSPGATCDHDNGITAYDFSSPAGVDYVVSSAAPVITKTYNVKVTVLPPETGLIWNIAGSGAWDLSTPNWLGQTSSVIMPFFNDANVLFNKTAGGTITIASGMSPSSTTVSAASGSYIFSGGPLAGTGSLTKDGNGTLKVEGLTPNTYSGGTFINGGTLHCGTIVGGISPGLSGVLGTGPVTLGLGATIEFDNVTTANALISNGGKFASVNGWGTTWNGPITLNANTTVDTTNGNAGNVTFGGAVSGDGGLTVTSRSNGPTLNLSVANSYTGPTIVNSGKVSCKNPSSLGNGGALTIATNAKVALDYTGDHPVASLTLGGVTMTNPGTYGSLTSAAAFKSAFFDGTGTVSYGAPESAAYITSFGTNVTGSGAIIGTVSGNAATITWLVPSGTDLASLAPDFLMSPGATCSQRNTGDLPVPGFDAGPVVYSVTSQDTTITNVYTVTAEYLPVESTVIWNLAGGGNWDLSTFNWLGQTSGMVTKFVDGVNVIFNKTTGGTITVATGVEPQSITVNAASGNYTFSGGPIAGTGSLIKDGSGSLYIDDLVSGTGTVVRNTFSGGTIMNNGKLHLGGMYAGVSPDCKGALGTGTVTLNGGTIEFDRYTDENPLIVNGGTLYSQNGWGATWSGPITLNANLTCNTGYGLTCSGGISGAGGLIKTGNDTLTLSGSNSYSGPTTINAGTVAFTSATDQTLQGDISGSGKLTKAGAGTLTLTGVVSYTGTTTLTAGTLVFSNAASQTLAAISGAGNLTQAGPGVLTLGTNTYTGNTTVTGGTLIVNGSSLSDTGKLVITGGQVEPNGTETVGSLYFGNTPKAVGTWGASGSGAANIDDVHFTGTTGVVNVLSTGPGMITGKVTLEDGTTPVVGAKVTAAGALLSSNTLTLADGTYSVAAQIGDTVNVSVAKGGHVVTYPVSNLYTINTETDPMTDINFRMKVFISKLVNLKAKDLAPGPLTNWTNTGTAGGVFTTIAGTGTAPEVKDVGGNTAVAITAGYGLASSINTPAVITGTNPWTMAAWVYRDANIPWQGSEECIIGLGNSDPYDLIMLNYSNDPDWGYIDSGVVNFGNSNPPARGVWHSIVATYDGTTVNYYADKVLLGSGSGSLRTPALPMTVGFVFQGNGSTVEGWSRSWASIASIEIYDDALSKAAIDAIYDAGLPSGGGSYADWAGTNAPGQTPGQDYDNDGVQNGIEYFMGQTGSSFTTMPGLDATNTVTWTKDPAYKGGWQIQTSPDLSTWTNVAGTDNTTSVSYTLPSGMGKLFVRLLVTPTP